MKKSSINLPILAVISAAIMAGSSGVFVKLIDLPPSSLAFVRVTIPLILIGTYLLTQQKPLFREKYPQMLVGSALNAIRIYLFVSAFMYTSISKAILILYTWPIFTNIFSILFLKERVYPRNIVLLLVAFGGIIFVNLQETLSLDNQDFIGLLAALGAAFIYAATVVIFKPLTKFYTSFEIVFYQNLVSIFIFFPLFLQLPMPSPFQLGLATAFSILMGILGFLLFFYALKHLPASLTSSLAYIEIISATLFGIGFFQDTISWNMLIGGAMIILSTALLKKS